MSEAESAAEVVKTEAATAVTEAATAVMEAEGRERTVERTVNGSGVRR
jgi:hypothetical protein